MLIKMLFISKYSLNLLGRLRLKQEIELYTFLQVDTHSHFLYPIQLSLKENNVSLQGKIYAALI